MLELRKLFRGQVGSAHAIHVDPIGEVQEVTAISPKDILMHCKALTAVAEKSVVPALVFEILGADRLERHGET